MGWNVKIIHFTRKEGQSTADAITDALIKFLDKLTKSAEPKSSEETQKKGV